MSALDTYLSVHNQICSIWSSCEGECNCGLEEAILALKGLYDNLNTADGIISSLMSDPDDVDYGEVEYYLDKRGVEYE